MKLLLTSSGITNPSIAKALFELVGKKPEDTSLVFIPTASNVEIGDKEWLIDDLVTLKNLNLKQIEISDISAVDRTVWQPQFEQADVLYFEGGNTYHLMEWINKSGLVDILPKLLETKVYVGVSAGSAVTNKDLGLDILHKVYEEDLDKTEHMNGLNYVDFYLLPHLNSVYFPKVRKENIEDSIRKISEKLYAVDDDTAIKVINGKVDIISEGEHLEYN